MQSSNEITENLISSWDTIKTKIKNDLGMTTISYNTWIEPLTISGIEDNVVTIVIHSENDMTRTYIGKNYGDIISFYIADFLGDNIEVSFVLENEIINKEETPENNSSEDEEIRKAAETSHNIANLNPKYVFDSFIVGDNNKLAYSAALAVAENPGKSYNPLFLYGGPGLGKTHLMHSIGHYILEQNPDLKVLYVTSEDFTNEVIESIRKSKLGEDKMTKLREKYRTVDVLMVDDVQFIIGKEATQEEFFHTFNALHQVGKQIVLSSDRPPREIETLEERLKSRFEMGLATDIQSPKYETRVAILRKKAEAEYYGRKINDDIINYIANNITSNVRELEGALTKIIAHSRLINDEPTLESAKEALKDIIYPEKNKVITPALIIETVCEQYGIKKDVILSKKRNAEIVLPRQIIMYLCREYTDTSLEEIGKILGKKDHTTVMSGDKKIREQLKTDDDLSRNIDIIVKKINPPL
jgi:chromosomal replication initiator protein